MPTEDKTRGKPPSLKSRAIAVEILILAIADIVLRMELDPEEKSKLLARSANVSRQLGLRDTGWYDDPKGVEQ